MRGWIVMVAVLAAGCADGSLDGLSPGDGLRITGIRTAEELQLVLENESDSALELEQRCWASGVCAVEVLREAQQSDGSWLRVEEELEGGRPYRLAPRGAGARRTSRAVNALELPVRRARGDAGAWLAAS